MKGSILEVFEQVFVNEPIEIFSQSWDIVIYGLTTPYLIFYIAILLFVVFVLFNFSKHGIDAHGAFSVVFLLVVVIAIGGFFVKRSYIDNLVEEKFMPKLTQAQISWLESEKIKRIRNETMKNDLSKKQLLNIEPVFKSIDFQDLEIILKREDLKTNGSSSW